MTNQELKYIQEKAFCNWCRRALSTQVEKITDKNLIEVSGKKWGDGSIAVALYCNECLGSDQRVKQPKSAVNLSTSTLDEAGLEYLFDSAVDNNNNSKVSAATTSATSTIPTTTKTTGKTVKLEGKL